MPDKLPFSWQKPGSSLLYFRRRVPGDIQRFLASVGSPHAGNAFLVISLKTSNPRLAELRIAHLVRHTNRVWAMLRDPTRESHVRQAYQLLEQHGVNPANPKADPKALGRFYETIVQKLPPSDREAIEKARQRPAFTLADCLDQYVAARPATKKNARIAFVYLRNYLGTDHDIRRVRRRHVNDFLAYLLAGGHNANGTPIRTTTVARYVNTLKAAFGRAIRENELGIRNVFSQVEIPNKGKDAQERLPFTVDQLRALHAAVDQWVAANGWDQLRCIVAVLVETGSRLAEVVGLAAADIRLDATIPHIALKPHPWRSLKTPGSTRKIPLTARALAALKAAQGLSGGSPFAFPRYTTAEGCSANSVSAALNKWMSSQDRLRGCGLTCHSLRHSMKDRLRAAQCPSEATDQLLGHRTPGVGARYGQGYPLEHLAEWLTKATEAIR